MQMVVLTALGVGGATIFGTVLGFAFRRISHKFSDIILSFAAGVMLAAAIIGLVLPSLDYGGQWGIAITVAGIFCGAVCLNLFDKLVPHLHKLSGADLENHPEGTAQLAEGIPDRMGPLGYEGGLAVVLGKGPGTNRPPGCGNEEGQNHGGTLSQTEAVSHQNQHKTGNKRDHGANAR